MPEYRALGLLFGSVPGYLALRARIVTHTMHRIGLRPETRPGDGPHIRLLRRLCPTALAANARLSATVPTLLAQLPADG